MKAQPIFITGTSGIGKTTMAKYISARYMIPFVNGSSSVLWEKYNIRNHTELLQLGVNEPEKGMDFQLELLDHRLKLIKEINSPHFVTDRSVVDNLVYFLFQNAPYLSEENTRYYINRCIDNFKDILEACTTDGRYKLIYLSRDFLDEDMGLHLEDDKKRITNRFFQDMMSDIFDRVLEKSLLKFNHTPEKYLRIRSYDWERRLSLIDIFLEKEPNMFDFIYNNYFSKS